MSVLDTTDLVPQGVGFRVLGRLGITDGRTFVPLSSSKPATLLATLLLNANTIVSVDYLIRAVWDDNPPDAAKSAVHTCVQRLRRLFTNHGLSATLIETLADGYRISADPQSLDLLHFRDLLRSAHAAQSAETKLGLLRQALALWPGHPILGNVHSALLARDEVPRLAEERLGALELVFDVELARGRCREMLPDVLTAAWQHPVHERFSEQLIEALYRCGRRAEALAEYRRIRDYLRRELGIDPGTSLQRLELAILRADPLDPPSADPGPRRPQPPEPEEGLPGSGALVLDRLLRVGLLEKGPEGSYRMNGLLDAFAQAAAGADGPARPDTER